MAGFKISSFGELKTVANKLNSNSATAQSKINETVEALTALSNNMSGEGVDTALTKLEGEVENLGSQLIDIMNKVHSFITTQTQTYAMANADASADLQTILSSVQSVDTSTGKLSN